MIIIGVGEQILDIIYKTKNGKPFSYAYDGGGTVWNILANISFYYNRKSYCISNMGSDWAATIIKKNLKLYNIDYNNCTPVKYSKIYHSLIPIDIDEVKDESTKILKNCPLCDYRYCGTTKNNSIKFPEQLMKKKDVAVCFDNLVGESTILKNIAYSLGWIIGYDIGYIGYLRYIDKDKILEKLKNISYLQMPNKVAQNLIKRFEVDNYMQLGKVLNCNVLCITLGSDGCCFVIKNKKYSCKIVSKNNIVDATGAGDGFFAGCFETYLNYYENKKTVDEKYIEDAFNEGQNIAKKVVENIGARGHMHNLKFFKIKNSTNICPSCKNEYSIIKKTVNFNNTSNNIKALLCKIMYKSNITDQYSIFSDIISNSTILIIGTGGSYSAAEYITHNINTNFKNIAIAKRPNQLDDEILKKFNCIILLSYSGKTFDIIKLISKIDSKVKIYFFTKQPNSIIRENMYYIYYDDYFLSTKREKSFLAYAGTIIPSTLFTTYNYKYENDKWNIIVNSIFNYWDEIIEKYEIFTHPEIIKTVDVFYDIDSYSAAIDIESKFIESGLARVTLHEKKDFSHGRFSILENNIPDIIIYMNRGCDDYEEILYNNLRKYFKKELLIEFTDRFSIDKAYSYLIMVQLLFLKIYGNRKKHKTEYFVDSLKLYRYKEKHQKD